VKARFRSATNAGFLGLVELAEAEEHVCHSEHARGDCQRCADGLGGEGCPVCGDPGGVGLRDLR